MKFHSNDSKDKDLVPRVRWAASFFISGLQGLLGQRPANRPSRLQIAISEIRASMLECLTQYGIDSRSALHRRIAYAHDIQDLWYLRGDVMAVIASNDGEVVAKKKLALISQRFNGLLPRALTSRASPLDD